MSTRIEQPIVCPVLVGRGPALAALSRLVERCATGEGGAALVVGGAGIGKSRLLAEIAARAADRGCTVPRARCHEAEHDTPYLPLLRLLQRLDAPEPSPGRDRASWFGQLITGAG
jgi:predicted ATPase